MSNRRSIARLNTVDQGAFGKRGGGLNLTLLIVWLVAGFNIGVIGVVVLALVILPVLIPNLDIRRHQADAASVAYVLITNTPTLTSTPTVTPTVPPPTLTPTPPATLEDQQNPITEPQVTTTPTPTFTPSPIPPTPTPMPPPASFMLDGITFHQQTWNNCGPANLAMALSFYDINVTQEDTAAFLKPDREDRNVTPQQMIDYVHQFTDLQAIWRMAGDLSQVKWLIAHQFIVVVESGYDPNNGEGWYGHYETVVGYDDVQGTITVYDSYLGRSSKPSLTRSYEIFDRDWQQFNRNYIVIYPPTREAELAAFLGSEWTELDNRRKAVEVAQREVQADPDNGYAWFNLGTSLVAIARYEEAVVAYSRATEFNLPYRMMWYQFGPFEALLQTNRLSQVLQLASDTLKTTRYVEEMFYYRGRVFEVQGNAEAAIEEYDAALTLNPNYSQAQAALRRVQG